MSAPISQFECQEMQRRLHLSTDDAPIKRTSPDDIAEAKLHAEIIKVCIAQNWPFVHSRMDRKTTTKKGVPDFGIITELGTVWIECKGPETKTSPAQRIFIAMAKKLGTHVKICRSMADFWEAVK